jgi:hypothetical protein
VDQRPELNFNSHHHGGGGLWFNQMCPLLFSNLDNSLLLNRLLSSLLNSLLKDLLKINSLQLVKTIKIQNLQ